MSHLQILRWKYPSISGPTRSTLKMSEYFRTNTYYTWLPSNIYDHITKEKSCFIISPNNLQACSIMLHLTCLIRAHFFNNLFMINDLWLITYKYNITLNTNEKAQAKIIAKQSFLPQRRTNWQHETNTSTQKTRTLIPKSHVPCSLHHLAMFPTSLVLCSIHYLAMFPRSPVPCSLLHLCHVPYITCVMFPTSPVSCSLYLLCHIP